MDRDEGKVNNLEGSSTMLEGSSDSIGENFEMSFGSSSPHSALPEYTCHSGVNEEMTNKSPIEFFKRLIADSMLESIVEQYFQSKNVSSKSRAQLWDNSEHDIDELKRIICLVIIMECIHYPTIEDYWSTSWPFATVSFSSVLKRYRFSLLLRFLHLNDNSKYIPKGRPGHDPLYKIRPFMDQLIRNFQEAYTPSREISLDESMIGLCIQP